MKCIIFTLINLQTPKKKAVFHVEGPLLVLAGPGSGKTRVITYRIAALVNSGVNPRNICAITFTNKAAQEMRQRAISLGSSGAAHISTFHSLCVRILRRYADIAKLKPNFSIYSDSEQNSCIKQAIKDCELDETNFTPSRMREAISTLKNSLINANCLEDQADDFFSKSLAQIYHRYQHILSENNALDFDDLLMKAALLLNNHEEVREELSNRFKFLLVDEYQDTNHTQYKIAKSLVSCHDNICVAGDPDQSIYRWRGADIRNILAFESDWPDAVVVKLEENFRSSPDILQLADRLISANKNRKPKTLIPTKSAGKAVSIDAYEDEKKEASALVDKIRQLQKEGYSLKDMAVFYRVNAMSRTLEEVFIQNRIPYQIVRGVEFYNRKEIRDMLAYLKVLSNPSDEVALVRIINNPARGIGKTTINRVLDYASLNRMTFYNALRRTNEIKTLSAATKTKIAVFVKLIDQLKEKSLNGPVAPLMERVFSETGLEGSLENDSDALENIKELINSAALYDKNTENLSLTDYLQQIALFTDADTFDPSNERVPLMTLHTAKGLEFENVFIVGLEQGLLPHERSADNEDELEEERRLFFVGITRAKYGLHISYSKYRTFRGQLLRTIPSQFLFELGIEITQNESDTQYSYEDINTFNEINHNCVHFAPGKLVRHKKFGLGRIKSFIDMGENSIVAVRFNSTGRTKQLQLKYANLEVISV